MLQGQALICAIKATRILDTQRAIPMTVTTPAGLFGGGRGGRGCAVQSILPEPTIRSPSTSGQKIPIDASNRNSEPPNYIYRCGTRRCSNLQIIDNNLLARST
jgi:hypothetical protein